MFCRSMMLPAKSHPRKHIPICAASLFCGWLALSGIAAAQVEIYQIQGNGLSSPLKDQVVATQDNVVTAITDDGFFMQTPTARSDGDPETSDGILVFTGSAPTVAVGDVVDVSGTISEFFGLTEIANNPTVTIKSSGSLVPAPVDFDDATPSPNQPQPETELERYEGMLIRVTNGLTVAPSDKFGDIKIVATENRTFREPGIKFPGLSGLPVWDGNPEIFELDPDAAGLPDTLLPANSTIIMAQGPLTFAFGDYVLLPTEFDFALPAARRRRPDAPPRSSETIIASQNLERLFDDIDDPGVNDPIVTPEEYAVRLSKLSSRIRGTLQAPDILAVQEAEDLKTLQDVVTRIQSDDPSLVYTPYLEEGNDIGGIDVGFLVLNSVQVNSVTQIGKDATFLFDTVRTLHDRPPLILEAEKDGFPITVMVVHNRSLSGIEGSNAGFVRTKRFQQALWISQRVQEMQVADPDIHLIVTGDFNGFEFTDGYVDVLGQITGNLDPAGALFSGTDEVEPDLHNWVFDVTAPQRYSFIFEGSAQTLDHMLTSAALEPFVDKIIFARGNADSPVVLQEDGTTSLRTSDHDGVLLFVNLVLDAVESGPGVGLPTDFTLFPNYPNPFNPTTTFRFALPHSAKVRLTVYDALGRTVRTLLSGQLQAGTHLSSWDGQDDGGAPSASGVYFARLHAGDFSAVRKLLLLR